MVRACQLGRRYHRSWAGAGGHFPILQKVYFTRLLNHYVIVTSFKSRHNSHTGHCCVISFGAGKRLDAIITIMKHVQCSVSCPPGKQKVGVKKICSLTPLAKFYPHLQNRGAALACQCNEPSLLLMRNEIKLIQ